MNDSDTKNPRRKHDGASKLMNAGRGPVRGKDICQVLFAVYQLLEEYGPVWYTAALNRRIRAALDINDGSCHQRLRL